MKKEIREELITLRKIKGLKWVEEKSSLLCERICANFPLEKLEVIAFYYPFNHEVDLRPIMEELFKQNKKVVLPKVLSKTTMAFFPIADLTDVERSRFGVLEPRTMDSVDPNTIDLMFIPGVAFSKDCYRLGYGAGFYDRFLVDRDIQTVGVAYDFQVDDRFPIDPHDVPLNFVITESRLLQRHSGDGSSSRSKDN